MEFMFPRTNMLTIIIGNCKKSRHKETIYPALRNSMTRQIMQMLPIMEITPANEL